MEDYPHAPWYNYQPDTEFKFTPNPCAVAASVLLYGTDLQRTLGEKVAERCMDFILQDEKLMEHDTYCLQRLFLVLNELSSPLLTQEVIAAMNQRVQKGVCTVQSKWVNTGLSRLIWLIPQILTGTAFLQTKSPVIWITGKTL